MFWAVICRSCRKSFIRKLRSFIKIKWSSISGENINMAVANNGKLVKLIAIWMVLISLPWIQFFYTKGFMPQSFLEALALVGIIWIIFCAFGLVFTKEMARHWAVWMLIIYFFWGFYLVCFTIAPFFSSSIEWLSS